MFFGNLSYFIDGLNGANLIISGHNRDKHSLTGDGFSYQLRVNQSVFIYRKPGDLKPLSFQGLDRIHYRGMFYLAGDNMLTRRS